MNFIYELYIRIFSLGRKFEKKIKNFDFDSGSASFCESLRVFMNFFEFLQDFPRLCDDELKFLCKSKQTFKPDLWLLMHEEINQTGSRIEIKKDRSEKNQRNNS